VATMVEKSGLIPAVTYTGRLTTRPLRNDGEQEGKDGRFGVPPEEFEQNPDLFYHYEKYSEHYGFSRKELRKCLEQANTFIVGGEPNTANPIRDRINSLEERRELSDISLRAITVLVRRPINEILLGIIARDSADSEKLKRIKHIVETQMVDGTDLAFSNAVDYTVENGEKRLENAVQETVSIIKGERERQLKELFGSSFRIFTGEESAVVHSDSHVA